MYWYVYLTFSEKKKKTLANTKPGKGRRIKFSRSNSFLHSHGKIFKVSKHNDK